MRENFQYTGVRQRLANVGERALLEMDGGDHMEEEKTWKPSEGRRGEGGVMRDEGSMRTLSTAKEICGGIPSRSGQSGLCSRTMLRDESVQQGHWSTFPLLDSQFGICPQECFS